MGSTGSEQDRRPDPVRANDDRRTFTRRIDCADAGPRDAVNPAAADRERVDRRMGPGRRKLDID